MFKYYLYAAFISGILFTTPITILVYKLVFAIVNKITYIGEFFGYGY